VYSDWEPAKESLLNQVFNKYTASHSILRPNTLVVWHMLACWLGLSHRLDGTLAMEVLLPTNDLRM